ncbi:glycosyltransferase family 2 protein [Nonlabens sp.]|uniref:glycosyltransferase family 2 protein n=1 Tax=Nonlabens sp. TaxID=1888209 RepID=UPI001BCB1CF8|nr:glycosyltransferase family 2 protein [Nonlabens sp.]
MELSIVILNYNTSAFLELCLYSVLKATKNIEAEIIVADNNSIDSSLEMVASVYAGRVKVMANDENYGFSKGNNLAVAQAQGTYLCILNPDTLVGEKVFEECLAFARRPELVEGKATINLGFIGTQLIDGTGAYLPESKRHIPTPKVARQKMLGNKKNYYYHEVDQNQRGKVDVLVGAFMFCDKKVYDDCGGFDERYFMYGEDIDLSYTALQKGYENYYLGDQKVIHFKGESTVKDKVYLQRFYGAMGLFYDKYFKQSALEKKAIDLLIQGMIAFPKSTKNSDRNEVTEIVLVTDDPTYRLDKITCWSLEQLKGKEAIGVQIWWDLKSLELTAIMKYMSENTKYRYRFIAQKRDFCIGSDSNRSRGEVKQLQ